MLGRKFNPAGKSHLQMYCSAVYTEREGYEPWFRSLSMPKGLTIGSLSLAKGERGRERLGRVTGWEMGGI